MLDQVNLSSSIFCIHRDLAKISQVHYIKKYMHVLKIVLYI